MIKWWWGREGNKRWQMESFWQFDCEGFKGKVLKMKKRREINSVYWALVVGLSYVCSIYMVLGLVSGFKLCSLLDGIRTLYLLGKGK